MKKTDCANVEIGPTPDNGFSLIEILVALGIFSFVSMAFASFISHTAKELRAANQKTEILSFERDLETALRIDSASCSSVVRDSTFDRAAITGTSGPVIQLPNGLINDDGTVLAAPSEPLAGTTTGLRVARTELEVFRQLDPPNDHIYQGRLRVFMDPESTVRSFMPTSSQIWFQVDPSSDPGSRLILDCIPGIAASPCDDGEIQVGTGTGDAVCTSMAQLIGEAFQNLTCPPDTILGGVNPDGTAVCRPMPNMGGSPPPPSSPGDGTPGLEFNSRSCNTRDNNSRNRGCTVYCDAGWTRTGCSSGGEWRVIGDLGCWGVGRRSHKMRAYTTVTVSCMRAN